MYGVPEIASTRYFLDLYIFGYDFRNRNYKPSLDRFYTFRLIHIYCPWGEFIITFDCHGLGFFKDELVRKFMKFSELFNKTCICMGSTKYYIINFNFAFSTESSNLFIETKIKLKVFVIHFKRKLTNISDFCKASL